MAAAFHTTLRSMLPRLLRRRDWLLLTLTVLGVLAIRAHLLERPLERDEGEQAYVGQLMLQGNPPYLDVHTSEFPGTYAAYALVMALLGQSSRGIHLGLAAVNLACLIMVFLAGRRLLDNVTGVVAALAFGFLSLSPAVQGLAAHASQFMILPALGGALALLQACQRGSRPWQGMPPSPAIANNASASFAGSAKSQSTATHCFLAGVLFGLAFLVKQAGLYFGLAGAAYLLRVRVGDWLAASSVRSQEPGLRSLRERVVFDFSIPPSRVTRAHLIRDTGALVAGWALPCAGVCLALWTVDALRNCVFWAFTFVGGWSSLLPLSQGVPALRAALRTLAEPEAVFWVLALAGMLVMWWERRFDASPAAPSTGSTEPHLVQPEGLPPASSILCPRFFLILWLLGSLASASAGPSFSPHCLIAALPAIALLAGTAVSRAVHLLRHDVTIELFLALPILGLLAIAMGACFIGHGATWLTPPADQARPGTLLGLFAESARVGDYLRSQTRPGARIAVLGSEPEIYFHAHRHAATGFLRLDALMAETPTAQRLQEALISEIERARPEYVVYVDDPRSWRPKRQSCRRIFEWWNNYWATELDLVKTIPLREEPGGSRDKDLSELPAASHLLLFKRRG